MKKTHFNGFLVFALLTGVSAGFPLFLGAEPPAGPGNLEKGLKADGAGDYAQAMKLYQKAADDGAAAECNIGSLYAQGRSVTQNYQEAMKWFQISAAQGNAAAECNMGVMFEKGHGVPQDYKEAMKWFQKAAAQGNALAEYNIGALYAQGHGVSQDDQEAMKWYQKAAAQGFVPAQKVIEEIKKIMAN